MGSLQEEVQRNIKKFKVHQKDGIWFGYRTCPTCNNLIESYATERYYLIRNLRKFVLENTNCLKCSVTGSNNPFFNKKHSKETKKKISNSRKDKACGKDNAMAKKEYREKVSKALKKKYASGELDFLKKIQSESAKKSHSEGKIKTFPVSKAEIEIKKNIENLGYIVDTQFHIGSLQYDFFIKELNLLVEYNGNYWHCNPVKYKKDYFHQKKKMYAHQIWEHDEKKKKIAIKKGYDFLTIWEEDYNKNKEKEIKKIIK